MKGYTDRAALVAALQASLAALAARAEQNRDPRLRAIVVRRRASLLRLRQAMVSPGPDLWLRRRGGAGAEPFETLIAGEWRLAHKVTAALEALGRSDPAFGPLSALRDEIEEAALSLRVIGRTAPGAATGDGG
ncbi:MAG: hypothetical protein KF887_19140 [Paracoccaceae bacterium]|nr:MAG: hypothetical protein KF887_19140 [Paracoccaceae bacterium]